MKRLQNTVLVLLASVVLTKFLNLFSLETQTIHRLTAKTINNFLVLQAKASPIIVSSKDIIDDWQEEEPRKPGNRVPGGSREGCVVPDETVECPAEPVIALVPVTKRTLNSIEGRLSLRDWEKESYAKVDPLGLTLNSHPTFWFYIPELPTEWLEEKSCFARFDIEDYETEEPVIDKPISVPLHKSGGIIGLSLSPQTYSLKPYKRYSWIFSIDCLQQQFRIPNVIGSVVKVEPPSDNFLSEIALAEEQSNLEQLFSLYWNDKNQLWHEALTLLAKKRLNDSQQDALLDRKWQELLSHAQVDLYGDLGHREVLNLYTLSDYK